MARRPAGPTVPPLPARDRDVNKGDCGKVLVVGGCRGMAGAPCLAARGACRGGAGLVKVAVPETIWDVVAVKLDECITEGLPATPSGALDKKAARPLQQLCEWADVAVIGMGLGREGDAMQVLRRNLDGIGCPVVLDADGLYAFSGKHLTKLAEAQDKRERPLVLTPHPGELARLWDVSTADIQKDRRTASVELAKALGAVVVLKGAGTIVTDGKRVFVNATGNPGMATGGTGDVLAGLIGALIGQGMRAFEAAVLGVHLHGLAGDLAARRLGPWSLVAGDVVDELPNAFLRHARRR